MLNVPQGQKFSLRQSFHQDERNSFFSHLSLLVRNSFSLDIDLLFGKQDFRNLRNVFTLSDLMHHDQKRKTGENRPYFDHIKDVTSRVIKNSEGILDISTEKGKNTLKKRIIIAMLHDIIEDTGVSYPIIKELFGEEIAISVQKLTKQTWILYCEDHPDVPVTQEQKKLLSRVGIAQDVLELPIDIKNIGPDKIGKIQSILPLIQNRDITIVLIHTRTCNSLNVSPIITFLESNNIKYRLQLDIERDTDMKSLLQSFELYKDLCREERDKNYHGKLRELDEDELFVKLCDRESNLSDLEGVGIEKEIKTLIETITYYLTGYVENKFPQLFKNIKESVQEHFSRIKMIPSIRKETLKSIESILQAS